MVASVTASALVMTGFDTPVGSLTVVASDAGLRAVMWPGEIGDGDTSRVRGLAEATPGSHGLLHEAKRQLSEYFAGTRREFDLTALPLDPQGTEFQRRAWAVLRTIPFGETMTYGEQARALGDVNKARAVGAANARNPISIIVPCHRVVGSDGSLTGFAGGMDAKRFLLAFERR